MIKKPETVFGRIQEWDALTRFVERGEPGAKLGLVYGRRRQGKTYLLANLINQTDGFIFGANQESAVQSLQAFSESYCRYLDRPITYFATWREAIDALFRLGSDGQRPIPVVIDEFSYLMDAVAGMASIVQLAMDPGTWAYEHSRVRLVLCGSAMTTMRNLLGGSAPLRGRATLNMIVHPFRYRDSAAYWGLADQPELAFRVNALLGGTPAYRRMVGDVPNGIDDFDSWVCQRLLNPNEVIFAEGNVLLHQQPELVDPALYFAVLAAISRGAHRRGEIANALGRPPTAIGHPLSVLEDVRFIERTEDALRSQRPVYSIAEPVIRWHQLVVSHNEALLAIDKADLVWASARDTVSSKIYGPHFEALAREWCLAHASAETLGGMPTVVRPATIACTEHRISHEMDVVALRTDPSVSDRVLAIGEAKATAKLVGEGELTRLEHVRDLLPTDKVNGLVKLLLFSRSGFTAELRKVSQERNDVELIDIERLYHGD